MLDGMTNIKASEVLKEIKYYTEDLPPYSPDEVAEALEMAIKALEQQPTDAVSRSELQKTMDSLPLFRFVNNDHEEADDYYNCESVDMVIRNLPSVTPRRDLAETSQDCVSRKAVRKILVEAKEYGSWDDSSQINRQDALDYVDMLPSVTPQASEEDIHREREQAFMLGYENASKKFRTEPCEDCISREAVLDVINFEDKWLFDANGHNANTHIAFSGLESRVKALPSVKPKYTDEEIDKAQAVEQAYVDKMVELAVEETKRPKGHWIIIDDCELFMAKCSECGEIVDSRMINKYPYCHCGAEMSGGGEDEEEA